MLGNIANLAVWLLVAVCLVVFGWEEPLRYHFISADQVKSEEQAYQPTPPPVPDYQRWNRPAPGRGGGLGDSPLNGRGLRGTPHR